MAARHKQWTPEKVRARIQTSMLVRRLKNHVLGKNEMSPTQVRAAEVLLKKALPDLSQVEHSGEVRHRDVSDQPLTADQWEQQYSDRLEAPAGSPESSH